MEILIRPATWDDKQVVYELLQHAKLAALDDSSQFGPQYVVACDANQSIVGVAGVEVYESVGLLRSVVVAEGQRGQGIGKTLASNRVAWAASHGIEELYLLTNDAVEYWQSRGFRVNRAFPCACIDHKDERMDWRVPGQRHRNGAPIVMARHL